MDFPDGVCKHAGLIQGVSLSLPSCTPAVRLAGRNPDSGNIWSLCDLGSMLETAGVASEASCPSLDFGALPTPFPPQPPRPLPALHPLGALPSTLGLVSPDACSGPHLPVFPVSSWLSAPTPRSCPKGPGWDPWGALAPLRSLLGGGSRAQGPPPVSAPPSPPWL